MAILQLKRGLRTNLPTTALLGEPLVTTDTKELFIGTGVSIVKISDIFFVNTELDLPAIGDSNKIYIVKADANFGGNPSTYIYDTVYKVISGSGGGGATEVIINSNYASLPAMGIAGVIYIVKTDETKDNRTTQYIWDGLSYIPIEVKMTSSDIAYNNTLSLLTANNVKDAIDEVNTKTNNNSTDITNIQGNITTMNNSLSTAQTDIITLQTNEGKVKMNVADVLDFFDTKIDGTTLQNVANQLKAISLDGLLATISELNFVSGATSNLQSQINAFATGTSIYGSVPTHADMLAIANPTGGMVVFVMEDSSHGGARTFYVYRDVTSTYDFLGTYDFVNSATTTTEGTIQLTGDLTGTSTNPQLANTGVVASTYTHPTLTIDSKGRIISATNGTAPPQINDTVISSTDTWSSDKINTEINNSKSIIGTKTIDEANISDKQVINYNSATSKLEYIDVNLLINKQVVFLTNETLLPAIGDTNSLYLVKVDSTSNNNPTMYFYDTTYKMISGGSSGGGSGSGFNYEVATEVNLTTLTPTLNQTALIRNYNGSGFPNIAVYDGSAWKFIAENYDSFTKLKDTPASYTGQAGKYITVKSTEDGVEFVSPPSVTVGGSTAFMIQKELLGVNATVQSPHIESISIPANSNYSASYVSILKYVNGVQNQVVVVNDFIASEKANSTSAIDDKVIFDGKLKLHTNETKAMSEVNFGTGKMLTIPIDRTGIKKIEKIEII